MLMKTGMIAIVVVLVVLVIVIVVVVNVCNDARRSGLERELRLTVLAQVVFLWLRVFRVLRVGFGWGSGILITVERLCLDSTGTHRLFNPSRKSKLAPKAKSAVWAPRSRPSGAEWTGSPAGSGCVMQGLRP